MSIKEYYHRLGNTSLNISLYFIVIGMLLNVYLLMKNQVIYGGILFIAVSFLYYSIHLYYVKKSQKVQLQLTKEDDTRILNRYILESNHGCLYYFSPNGIANVKVKLKYTIKGVRFSILEKDNELGYVIYRNKQLQFYLLEKLFFGTVSSNGKHEIGNISIENSEIHLKKSKNNEFKFMKDNQIIAEVKKGWLPISWTKIFRLNTPVLLFQDKVTTEEKLAILLILPVVYNV
ncbi:hypothetical protein OEV98_08540 [Caldibacillus lycopersici]|uniref:Uncharacterized protein n=1 Tax=Perspicuibacillus lycopersici TaxID=1325689 RepID=A0AAE3ISD9_9BACI|nr:hypothetical protein [Perspicuibacillus lycopersici]MCU9613606.1 hypothetical protein [Perspicuibacillus lycopersici]